MSARIPEPWRVALQRGVQSLSEGDTKSAEQHFTRAWELAPERPEVNFALGRERLRRGRLDDAEPLLRAAWERGRGTPATAVALARCLGAMHGRREEAHHVLDDAFATLPGEPSLMIARAELWLDDDRWAEARGVLETAARALDAGARVDRRDVGAMHDAVRAGLARCANAEGLSLAAGGRVDEALFAFKRASDLDDSWLAPLVNQGVAFSRLGRPARARSCWERALAREPHNAAALFNLAAHALTRGAPARAAELFRACLATDPGYPGAHLALAESLAAADQPDAAADELETILRLEPTNVDALCLLAKVSLILGRYATSGELAARARAIDPTRADKLLS